MKREILAVLLGGLAIAASTGYADTPGAASKPSAAAFVNPFQPVEGYDYKSILYNVNNQTATRSVSGQVLDIMKEFTAFTKEAYHAGFPDMTLVYSEASGDALKQEAAKSKLGFVIQIVMPNFGGLTEGGFLMTQQMLMMTKSGWTSVFVCKPLPNEGGVYFTMANNTFSVHRSGGRNPIKVPLCQAMLPVEYPLHSSPPAGEKPGPNDVLIGVKNYLPFEATNLRLLASNGPATVEYQFLVDPALKIAPGTAAQVKFTGPDAQKIHSCKSLIVVFGTVAEKTAATEPAAPRAPK